MKTSKATLQAVIVLLSFGFLAARSSGQLIIPATEAKNHIGEIATVYGKVYGIELAAGRYEGERHRQRYVTPIVLDIRESATNRTFSIILMDGNTPSLSILKELEGKVIAASGEIRTNRSGVPIMNIKSTLNVVNINSDFEALTRCQTNQSVASVGNTNTSPQTSGSPAKKNYVTLVDPSATNTITTISGAVYRNAKVTRFEPDGLTISFNNGFGGRKISFEDLLLECRQTYGYDAQKAAVYAKAKQQEAIQAQTQKQIEEEQQKLAAIQAQREQEQLAYKRAKAAYELAKEDYDRQIKLETLDAQQRAAYAQVLQAKQAAMQTELMRRDAIIKQQQLWELQNQTYQQQRAADSLDSIYWQNRWR